MRLSFLKPVEQGILARRCDSVSPGKRLVLISASQPTTRNISHVFEPSVSTVRRPLVLECQYPKSVILSQYSSMLVKTVIIAVVAVIILLLLIYIMISRIMKPLHYAVEMLDKVAAGI